MLPRNSKPNLFNSKTQPRLEAFQFFEVERKNFSLGRPPAARPLAGRPLASRPPATRSAAGRLPLTRSAAGPERKPKFKTTSKRTGSSHRTLSAGQIDFRQRRLAEPKPFLKSKSFSSSVAPRRSSEHQSPPSSPLAISSTIVASNRPQPSTMRKLAGPKPKVGPLSGARRVKIPSEPILSPTGPLPLTQAPLLRRQERRVQEENLFSLETETPAQPPAFLRRQARRTQEDGTCSSDDADDANVLAGDNPLVPTIILSVPPMPDASPLPHISHQTPGLGVATRIMTPAPRIVVADLLAPPALLAYSTVTPPCKELSRTPVNPPNRPIAFNAKGRRRGYSRVMSMQDEDVSPTTVRILEARDMATVFGILPLCL